MNTNPISFGRTIKVNASIPVAKHAADLINSVPNRRGESRVQQQLKGLFFDSEQGSARVITPYGKTGDVFIVTGEASNDIAALKKDRNEQLSAAKKNYGADSFTFNLVKEAEDSRYDDLVKLTIHESKEPLELNIDYSQRKHRIKSIDIIF